MGGGKEKLKMHHPSKGIRRFFSLFLSIVFLVSNNSYAVPTKRPLTINIPPEIGSIHESYSGSSDKFVIYLQDAHSHPEAQWNNYGILESMSKQFPIDTIFVEGTTGLVDTTPYLNLPDYEITLKTAEELLNQGYITGEEYFSLAARKNKVITGIESPALYKENINGLKEILKYKEDNAQEIKRTKLSLDINR